MNKAKAPLHQKKILVIAPHADDEVLGCGGYLWNAHLEGHDIFIAYGAVGGKSSGSSQVLEDRMVEAKLLNKFLKTSNWMVLFKGFDAYLDTVPDVEIITKLDVLIDSFKPDELFVNYASHHQDHRKMYFCTLASLRLRKGYRPSLVALYEYPFIGGTHDIINGGRWYHDISNVVDKKIEMFSIYGSQVKEAPSPLNENGIRSLARIRGMECGCEYAEMFYIQNMFR